MHSALDATQSRRLLRSLLIDFLLVIVLIIPIIICEFGIEPFRRGFFCNDETIQYPYLPSTISNTVLGLLVGLPSTLLIVLVEFVRFYKARAYGSNMQPLLVHWRVPAWVLECCRQVAYFLVGLLLTYDATEVGKYTIGRLRPHFMAVCQPQLLDGSTCNNAASHGRYIENYICSANGYTAQDVREARLSFPSGHSSLGFYAMVYMALYIQRRFKWRGSLLLRHSLQFLLLMAAWYTALSRVKDNWHHWSDVLVGAMMGVVGALLTARYISKLFKVRAQVGEKCLLKLQLQLPSQQQPQQTDVDMLQEVMTTPPPYTLSSLHTLESLSSGYSNEQYCTKV